MTHPDASRTESHLRLLTNRDLDGLGLPSRWTRRRLIAAGEFPAPIRIGSRTLWRASDVESFISNPATWRDRQAGAA